ncbi:Fatty acid desaturase [Geitlerinema sp. FC II]|nr:Fatty acid desaturase [Geitlerinema sp. FC II]
MLERILKFLIIVVDCAGPLLIAVGLFAGILHVTLLDISLLVGMHVITMGGVTVGYHRLLSHKAFKTGVKTRRILAILGAMSGQSDPIRWVDLHRRHHRYEDVEGDVHSPHLSGNDFWGRLKGFWYSHLGWIFDDDWERSDFRYAVDIQNDSVICFVSRYALVWPLLSFVIPAVLGGVLTGTWTGFFSGFFWGGLARLIFGHHVSACVNSVCHVWGSRPFVTEDYSCNHGLVAILTLGEGWHNNHHAFPYSARQGLTGWQIDPSWWFIQLLEKLGLAWDVRVPSPKEMLRLDRSRLQKT